MKNLLFTSLLAMLIAFGAKAERYKYEKSNKGDNPPGTAANCTPATAATELDINNTRALIQSGGDMWWDFNRARYEIPQGSDKTSLFAGSLWLAGQDVSGQFKVAALRFRQVGNDYWTGPLSTVNAEIDPQTCRDYDRHFETTKSMVQRFAGWYAAGQFDQVNGTTTQADQYEEYTIPDVLRQWPAHGRNYAPYNEDYYLAPFHDENGDGEYNIDDGDYPGYVLSGKSDCSRRVRDIYGDQNLWWVFNDKGNIHTESGGQSIGMEIRAQAFAFATTDEVNNMTFYNYELINRSTFNLTDTYFGQWVDGDLGNAQDDFVGCDVRRGLGYFYNGDDNDQDAAGNIGYGVNPPAIGVDFFQGPFVANDSLDNCLCDNYSLAQDSNGIVYSGQGAGYGDGIVDNERYGMRKFLYHNNAAGPTGDPNIATDYYNMLRGVWRDGTPMTFGGNGYNPSDPNAIPANYMFPGETDPFFWGTDGVDPGLGSWTESTAGNPPGDRRFVQSAGPFQLGPGAVNNITVGITWMQANSGGPEQSVRDMRRADDKTQALFDSCFEILDGPNSPDVTVQELDREVILMISNPINSNNYQEAYAVVDPFLAPPDSIDIDGEGNFVTLTEKDKELYATYKFEGYQIFQLADESVGTNDLDDADKARLVAQVDVVNDITTMINYEFDPQLDADVPTLKVSGENEGISHSFQFTEDAFAEGDARLINHKTYYYMAIAYAYNYFGDGVGNLQYIDGEYEPAADPPRLDGQKIPYLASRTSASGPVRVYEAIPHRTDLEQDGIKLNAEYGDGVELTRIEGRGNGGNYAVIKEDYIDSATSVKYFEELTYEAGNGPVNIKVVDPLVIPNGEFTIAFKDTSATNNYRNMYWELSGDSIATVTSDQTIRQLNEQVIFEIGLSVSVSYGYPGLDPDAKNNGFLGFSISYEDETDAWLGGLSDEDPNEVLNWIKAGTYKDPDSEDDPREAATDDHYQNYRETEPADDVLSVDENEDWENISGRTWAPFALAGYDTAQPIAMFPVNGVGYPRFSEEILNVARLNKTPSVDIIITDDKSKWTRCPVLEAGDIAVLNKGGALRGELRRGLSVDKEGRNQLDDDFDEDDGFGISATGQSQTFDELINNFRVDSLRAADIAYLESLGLDEDEFDGVSMGMGWFPGYAVNIETGERLNMAFSENSRLGKENGADMIWNPTDRLVEDLFNELRIGGMHMIYVFNHNFYDSDIVGGDQNVMPSYDGGAFAYDRLTKFDGQVSAHIISVNSAHARRYRSVMGAGAWVGYTMVAEGFELYGDNRTVEDMNDVTIQLRSTQPYAPYVPGEGETITESGSLKVGTDYYIVSGGITTSQTNADGDEIDETFFSGDVFKAEEEDYTLEGTTASVIEAVNGALPLYTFNTQDIAPTVDNTIGQDLLDEITAVPNPYYAYSSYETGRLDNRIKVINLPEKCEIKIYTVNGVLVRTFKKDDASISSVDWDLKNQSGIPIASGLYIIHIEAPGLGEKVIKWFGVLRPIDLNSF